MSDAKKQALKAQKEVARTGTFSRTRAQLLVGRSAPQTVFGFPIAAVAVVAIAAVVVIAVVRK